MATEAMGQSRDKLFAGKVALVTGGSKRIGLEVARSLAREGAGVAITGRNPQALAGAIDALGGNAIAITADVGDF